MKKNRFYVVAIYTINEVIHVMFTVKLRKNNFLVIFSSAVCAN